MRPHNPLSCPTTPRCVGLDPDTTAENVETNDEEALAARPAQQAPNAAPSGHGQGQGIGLGQGVQALVQGQGQGNDALAAVWQAEGVRVTTPPPHSRGQQAPPSPLHALPSGPRRNEVAGSGVPVAVPAVGSGVRTPPPAAERRSTNSTNSSNSTSSSSDSPPRVGFKSKGSPVPAHMPSPLGAVVGTGLGVRQSQKAVTLSVLEQQYAKEREAYRDYDVRSGSAALAPSSRVAADPNPYSYRTLDSPLDNSVSVVSDGSPEVVTENEGPPESRKL